MVCDDVAEGNLWKQCESVRISTADQDSKFEYTPATEVSQADKNRYINLENRVHV